VPVDAACLVRQNYATCQTRNRDHQDDLKGILMSEAERFQSPWNFLGLPAEDADPARARAWVLPIPYEATTSYGAGTRNGPTAILAASRQVELFDREFGDEPATRLGIHTMNPLWSVHRGPEAMVHEIEGVVAGILAGSPRPELLAILGGEHTISAGVVRGLARAVATEQLVAVQIDAHADLRDTYEGTPFSHACAARRILDVCPVFQVGIRNLSGPEEEFRRTSRRVKTIFAEEAVDSTAFLAELADFVRGKQVFLTIDLDGLDPSIMAAVGTPEPGGLSWQRTLDVVRTVCREAERVPVFDVVELAPIPALPAPDFLAARLVYKTIALALR
jgi:agmatinase